MLVHFKIFYLFGKNISQPCFADLILSKVLKCHSTPSLQLPAHCFGISEGFFKFKKGAPFLCYVVDIGSINAKILFQVPAWELNCLKQSISTPTWILNSSATHVPAMLLLADNNDLFFNYFSTRWTYKVLDFSDFKGSEFCVFWLTAVLACIGADNLPILRPVMGGNKFVKTSNALDLEFYFLTKPELHEFFLPNQPLTQLIKSFMFDNGFSGFNYFAYFSHCAQFRAQKLPQLEYLIDEFYHYTIYFYSKKKPASQ